MKNRNCLFGYKGVNESTPKVKKSANTREISEDKEYCHTQDIDVR